MSVELLLPKDKGWAPNKKQEPFLSLPLSIKEAFYGGGAGSGKSDVLLYYPIVWEWHLNPRFKQVFQRRTFPQLKNEIVPRAQEIYRKFGGKVNLSDMIVTFPRPDQFGGTGLANDGARVYLAHCENEEDVHNFDSMEINLYTPDELTSFTESIYTYIGFQRTRTSDPNLPAIIRAAGMPGGIGHTWVNNRFVKPCKEGGKIIVGRAGVKRIFIRATQADNPFIDKDYARSLAALPNEAERKAKLHGDFEAYAGQVFSEFRDFPNSDEPANAQHVIKPFDIPSYWPRLVIGDWGFNAMTYVLYAAISPDKRVYVYREQSWKQTKIADWAPYVRTLIEKENVKAVVFCRSAAQDRGLDHTVQDQIEEFLGRGIELSVNTPGSRVSGKSQLHEYLRWTPKPQETLEIGEYDQELADKLKRQGGTAYHEYIKLFSAPEDEVIPKLQIFNTCQLLIEAIKSCTYAKDSKNGVKAEDVEEFDGDDPYDTVRYLVDRADRYFMESGSNFEKELRINKIQEELQRSGDYTRFYMQARAMEAEKYAASVRGVRRYRH